MPLTEQQARPLAALIHQLRPEWDEGGILKQLQKCAHLNPFDVSMAAVRAATDLGAKTPGVIPSDGPHWHERLSEQRVPRNPPFDQCCATCSRTREMCQRIDGADHEFISNHDYRIELARKKARTA
jgi:hypothetical protein